MLIFICLIDLEPINIRPTLKQIQGLSWTFAVHFYLLFIIICFASLSLFESWVLGYHNAHQAINLVQPFCLRFSNLITFAPAGDVVGLYFAYYPFLLN